MKSVVIAKRIIILGLLAGIAVSASSVNITIPDAVPGTGEGPGSTGDFGLKEDNETEPGTAQGQRWDLERVVYTPLTGDLTIVGGFNFSAGAYNTVNSSTGAGSGRLFSSGDIWIDVDGGLLSNPGTSSDGYNLVSGNAGYDFVIHFKDRANIPGSPTTYSTHAEFGKLTSLSYEIYDIRTGATKYWDVYYGSTGEANPYIFDPSRSTGEVLLNTPVPMPQNAGFSTYEGAVAANAAFSGAADWKNVADWASGDSTVANGLWNNHYALTVNLANIATIAGVKLDEMKFTYGCGNDAIRGDFSKGRRLLPDGGSTLILLGLGMTLFTATRRSRS